MLRQMEYVSIVATENNLYGKKKKLNHKDNAEQMPSMHCLK